MATPTKIKIFEKSPISFMYFSSNQSPSLEKRKIIIPI